MVIFNNQSLKPDPTIDILQCFCFCSLKLQCFCSSAFCFSVFLFLSVSVFLCFCFSVFLFLNVSVSVFLPAAAMFLRARVSTLTRQMLFDGSPVRNTLDRFCILLTPSHKIFPYSTQNELLVLIVKIEKVYVRGDWNIIYVHEACDVFIVPWGLSGALVLAASIQTKTQRRRHTNLQHHKSTHLVKLNCIRMGIKFNF